MALFDVTYQVKATSCVGGYDPGTSDMTIYAFLEIVAWISVSV